MLPRNVAMAYLTEIFRELLTVPEEGRDAVLDRLWSFAEKNDVKPEDIGLQINRPNTNYTDGGHRPSDILRQE